MHCVISRALRATHVLQQIGVVVSAVRQYLLARVQCCRKEAEGDGTEGEDSRGEG